MASLGITDYLADKWGGTLCNVPYAAPMTAFKLHLDVPGSAGTAHPAATSSRQQATFTRLSSGVYVFTGLPPTWLGAAAETVPYLSCWDGLTDADNCLFTAAALSPRIIAAGDKVTLTGFTVTFKNRASD